MREILSENYNLFDLLFMSKIDSSIAEFLPPNDNRDLIKSIPKIINTKKRDLPPEIQKKPITKKKKEDGNFFNHLSLISL